jgi:hypothetical protein
MSEQREMFRNLIESAANHNEVAVTLLRQVVARVAKAAPGHSLIKLCRFIEREICDDADRDVAALN